MRLWVSVFIGKARSSVLLIAKKIYLIFTVMVVPRSCPEIFGRHSVDVKTEYNTDGQCMYKDFNAAKASA